MAEPTSDAVPPGDVDTNGTVEHLHAPQTVTEERGANTDKENQMPDAKLQSLEGDEEHVKGKVKQKKKGEGKVKRSSKRQVSQL